MTKEAIYIIGTLIAFIVGGGAFIVCYILADIRERRKHYRIIVTVQESGALGIHKSKLTERGREPLVIFPYTEKPLLQIDVKVLDAVVKVTDIRPER